MREESKLQGEKTPSLSKKGGRKKKYVGFCLTMNKETTNSGRMAETGMKTGRLRYRNN